VRGAATSVAATYCWGNSGRHSRCCRLEHWNRV